MVETKRKRFNKLKSDNKVISELHFWDKLFGLTYEQKRKIFRRSWKMINQEQMDNNWNELMSIIDEHFEGEQKENILKLHNDFETEYKTSTLQIW